MNEGQRLKRGRRGIRTSWVTWMNRFWRELRFLHFFFLFFYFLLSFFFLLVSSTPFRLIWHISLILPSRLSLFHFSPSPSFPSKLFIVVCCQPISFFVYFVTLSLYLASFLAFLSRLLSLPSTPSIILFLPISVYSSSSHLFLFLFFFISLFPLSPFFPLPSTSPVIFFFFLSIPLPQFCSFLFSCFFPILFIHSSLFQHSSSFIPIFPFPFQRKNLFPSFCHSNLTLFHLLSP